MTLRFFFQCVILLFTVISCDINDECATVLCAGDPVIGIEVLSNGDNVFVDQTFTIQDIMVGGTDAADFNLQIERIQNNAGEETQLLVVRNSRWGAQTYDLTLSFGSDTTAQMQLQIDRSEPGGCCGGVAFLEEITINGNRPQRNAEIGFYILNLE